MHAIESWIFQRVKFSEKELTNPWGCLVQGSDSCSFGEYDYLIWFVWWWFNNMLQVVSEIPVYIQNYRGTARQLPWPLVPCCPTPFCTGQEDTAQRKAAVAAVLTAFLQPGINKGPRIRSMKEEEDKLMPVSCGTAAACPFHLTHYRVLI